MFRRLLITTDFTDGLYRLVNFVPDLATMGLEQVVFFHCVPLRNDRGVPRVDEAEVEQARQRLSPALNHQGSHETEVIVDVMAGRLTQAIADAIQKYQADLVVVGMESHSLLNEKLFGSTTCDLAQHIPVPLLMLRPQLISTYTEEELALRCQHLFRDLLIPYDNSDSGKRLVDFVQEKVSQGASRALESCLLCWVVEKLGRRTPQPDPQIEENLEILQRIQAKLSQPNLRVKTDIRRGNAVTEIQEVALEFDISAIAVSSKHFGKLWELSIPSFTGELIRRCWHPVLFIPPEDN